MFKKITLQKMDKWKHITPVFCLFLCVKAQETSTNQHDFNPLHPNIAVVLVVLSILFFLTFMMVIFAKVCHTDNPPTRLQNFGEFVRTRSRFSGIDRAVVESLPFFQFSSLKGSKEGLECAVCLLMFEDTETLRVLPKCQHAFHMNCIDKWLENHSSCPLCRYKFDIKDLNNLTYTNSFSYPRISIDEPNLQFFIQREETNDKSSRFSVSSNTIQNLASVKKDKPLIQKFEKESILHSLKHKIIVSDVLNKSRWSDVNSSDMLSLSSEMLDDISGKRFSYMGSDSGMFTTELSAKEQSSKIKEDLERKRLYEYKVGKSENSCSSDGNKQLDLSISTEFRSFVTDDKRSMSEITNVPRFAEYNSRSRISTLTTPTSVETDDDKNRLWLTIAKKTILLFGGGGTRSDDPKGVEDV